MKNWQKIALTVAIVIVALGLLVLMRGNEDTWIKDSTGNWIKHGNPAIQDFNSCAAKYPVLLTYPEQCSLPNGPTFTKQ